MDREDMSNNEDAISILREAMVIFDGKAKSAFMEIIGRNNGGYSIGAEFPLPLGLGRAKVVEKGSKEYDANIAFDVERRLNGRR